ncbi:TetR/AcrR family transcriptional regulator [Modestobacter sp. SSW1-42]|uniref:TetR/AcrR family transcriptional regulator n=1 Tax=Modestobacter sp. SSW1-42 TaxID=596372 RepID=UPI003988437D
MGRPRSFDEEVAVARAGGLFAELGYEGTSIDDLVQRLGVHRGSLYSTFGSKRALYLRVLREHVDTLDHPAAPETDLTLLLRAAVERAPVDAEAATLVHRGLVALRSQLPSGTGEQPEAALARLLGEHLVRRATRPQEET